MKLETHFQEDANVAFPIGIMEAVRAIQQQCQSQHQATGQVPPECEGLVTPAERDPVDSTIMSQIAEEQARIQRHMEIRERIERQLQEVRNPQRPAAPEPASQPEPPAGAGGGGGGGFR